MAVVRLRTMGVGHAARVDRSGAGRILGASLIAAGPALGHRFSIDSTTLDQVASLAEGAPGRWTHGDLCADGLGTHLGRWRNVHREGERVLGDFHFSATARNVRPAGLSVDAPTYLMDLAENEPDVAGVSAVMELAEDATADAAPDADGSAPVRFARVARVLRADYVADPAANPDGLFSDTPSALADGASAALARACEAHGRPRVVSFLRTWLGETMADDSLTETLEAAPPAPPVSAPPAELAAADLSEGVAMRALRAEVDTLRQKVAAAAAEDTRRKAEEVNAYLSSLRAQAQPCAISEPDLARVRGLMELGDSDTARLLGRLLLSAAKGPAAPGGATTQITPASDPRKALAVHQAAQLRAAGWTVELSADGTEITHKTPPSRGEGR